MGCHGAVAIVTGASRGIGLGIAQRLVAEGARVVVTARKPEPAREAVAALGGDEYAVGLAGNAADPRTRTRRSPWRAARFGGLDYLVNNTGINPVIRADARHVDARGVARKILDTNVVAAFSWVAKSRRRRAGQPRAPWLGRQHRLDRRARCQRACSAGMPCPRRPSSTSPWNSGYATRAGCAGQRVAPAVVKTEPSRKALYAGREEAGRGGIPDEATRRPRGRRGRGELPAQGVTPRGSPGRRSSSTAA
jgi:hypothetical protein